MSNIIRPAVISDAEAVRHIYAPYVERSAISFEAQSPSVTEISERITKITQAYPWLVYERSGAVIGYAYASQHRAREAYRWSVDVAAYVSQEHCRQGVGRELYRRLLAQLEELRFANVFAGIALPNAASVGLHERMGFTAIGIYRNVGYKLGQWHDVGWWQKIIAHPIPPTEPLAPSDLAPVG